MVSRAGNGRRSTTLNRWHRRAGVSAALVLVYLLATGLPLQYSGELGLGQRNVSASLVLDWYGLEAPRDVHVSGGLVNVGDLLFADGNVVATLEGFRGAVAGQDSLQGLVVAAGRDAVLLLDPTTWSTVDRFDLPAGVTRIGHWNGRVLLETGGGQLAADENLLGWDPVALPEGAVTWAPLAAAGADQADDHRRRFRARMLSVERLLQDLHSGRVFGIWGMLVVDAATALLLFLCVSGLMMWWRRLG